MCISHTVVIGMLIMDAIQDIRKREIVLIPTVAVGIGGFVYGIVAQEEGILLLLINMVPAFLLFLMALVFQGQIGMGDVIVLSSICAWMPMELSVSILIMGMFFLVLAAVVKWGMRMMKKDLPFVPFLLAGEIVVVILG